MLSIACSTDNPSRLDAAVAFDASVAAWDGLVVDGASPLVVDLVVQGCERRSATQCFVTMPAELVFVLVTNNDDVVATWDFGDGSSSAEGLRATHLYERPGTYSVTVAAGGTGGTVSHREPDLVVVERGPAGAACLQDDACLSGQCVCTDGSCDPPLSAGLCLQPCSPRATVCQSDEVCVDLTSNGIATDEPWRAVTCLPACSDEVACVRPGFSCRWAPVAAGGWSKACLPPQLRSTGDACRTADAITDSSLCLGGLCLDLGSAGYCSSGCEAGRCPEGQACVTFSGAEVVPQGQSVCLQRCESADSCVRDAALACQGEQADGWWGFSLVGGQNPDPAATYCAPKRCEDNLSCGIGGFCDQTSGGFCRPLESN